MGDPLESLRKEAIDHRIGCGWRSKEHERSARRWRTWTLTLGTIAAVSAAVAGASLLAGAETGSALAIGAGVLALVGAAFTAANQVIGPQAKAEEHQRAAAEFEIVRSRYASFVRQMPDDPQLAKDQFDEIKKAHEEAKRTSPAPEKWTQKWADGEIKKLRQRK